MSLRRFWFFFFTLHNIYSLNLSQIKFEQNIKFCLYINKQPDATEGYISACFQCSVLFEIYFQTSPSARDINTVPLLSITISANGDKKSAVRAKSSPAEESSPDTEEPVILRKKKTSSETDKKSNPGDESTNSSTVGCKLKINL